MPAAHGEDTQQCQLHKEMRQSQDASSLHTCGSLSYLCQGQIYHVFFLNHPESAQTLAQTSDLAWTILIYL